MLQSNGEEQVVKLVNSVTLQESVWSSDKHIGGNRLSLKALT